MKTFIGSIIAFCGLVFTGCVPSIHPLYTEADLTFDPGLIGVWMDDEGKETWEIVIEDANEYRVVHTDEKGKKGEFEMRLALIDGRTFIDLVPVGPALQQNDFYAGHILPIHSFAMLQRSGSDFKISFLEPSWLSSHLAKNPGALRHTTVDKDILITDTPRNLQKFLTASVQSPGAFSEPVLVKRKRPRQ